MIKVVWGGPENCQLDKKNKTKKQKKNRIVHINQNFIKTLILLFSVLFHLTLITK